MKTKLLLTNKAWQLSVSLLNYEYFMFQFTYVFQASKELNLVIRKRAGLDLFPSESSGIYNFILFSFYMILRFFHSVLTTEK